MKRFQIFICRINYASSPLLEYAYPPINETIVTNITNGELSEATLRIAIIAVPKLYTQVLHLMNKMNLPPPFGPARKRPAMPATEQIKDEIKSYGESVLKRNHETKEESMKKKNQQLEEEEEEEEDEEEEEEIPDDKRPRIDNPFSKTEVIQPPAPSAAPAKEAQLIQPAKVISVDKSEIKSMFATPTAVRSCVPLQDILKHRISKEEMSHQKAFNNYSYGDPSCKLYLRNMAKDVTADDLLRLFGCFFDSDEEASAYKVEMEMKCRKLEIRIMEGRMRGQAFITFPSVELAREALVTVNGYLLKEKPIVIVCEVLRFYCSVLGSRRRERVRVIGAQYRVCFTSSKRNEIPSNYWNSSFQKFFHTFSLCLRKVRKIKLRKRRISPR